MSFEQKEVANRFQVDQEKCIRCGECVSDCPVNILVIGDQPPTVATDRENDCIGCQHCLAVCPTGAVSVLGLEPRASLPLENGFPSSFQLETLIRGRRSVRRYLDENVDGAMLDRLMETARYAPSGRNARQVGFSLIDDRSVMNQVRNRTMDLLAEVVKENVLPPGYGFFEDIVNGWQEFRADVVFRWAPHLLVATAPADCPSPEQDTIIALSQFELLACSMGLGTLWNGVAKMAMALVPEFRNMLAIPDGDLVGFVMSFGKPDVSYVRTVQYDPPPIRRVGKLV